MESFDSKIVASATAKKEAPPYLAGVLKKLRNFIPGKAASTAAGGSSKAATVPASLDNSKGVTTTSPSWTRASTFNRSLSFNSWQRQTPSTLVGAGPGRHSRSDSIDSVSGADFTTTTTPSQVKKSIPSIISLGYPDDFISKLRGISVTSADSSSPFQDSTHKKPDVKAVRANTTSEDDALGALRSLVRKIRGAYGQGEHREFWMRDELSQECYQCKLPFTAFRRKHHCRICGQVFCSKCASVLLPGEKFGFTGDVQIRVCDYCFKIMGEYDGDEADSQSSLQRENTLNGLTHIRRIFASAPSLFSSRFWNLPTRAIEPAIADSTAGEPIPDDLPFRTNINSDDEVRLPHEVDSDYSDDMENSLVSQFKRLSPRTIDEALDEVSEEHVLPRRKTTANSKYSARALRSQLSISIDTPDNLYGASAPNTPRNLSRQNRNAAPRKPLNPESPTLVQAPDHDNVPLIELNSDSLEFMRAFLRQIIFEYELSVENWEAPAISLIIKVCHSIQPNVRGGESPDILNYVKVKKIPGTTPKDSQFLNAVVFSGNVMHKRMARVIMNPRILVLTFPLEYYRSQDQFVSLGPVLSQESEYIRNLVNQILALKPDVLFVASTVSRRALEFLLAAEVVVVSNVKQSVVDRIARCTSADVVSTMDRITLRSDTKLGTCDRFYVKSFTSPLIKDGRKTLIFLDGCPPERGCSLILRGGNTRELLMFKRIVEIMCLLAYNLKLESYLIKDSFAAVLPSADALENCETLGNEDTPPFIFSRFVKPYDSTILSISPNVKFPAPFLLRRMFDFEKSMLLKSQAGDAEAESMLNDCRRICEIFIQSLKTRGIQDFELPGHLHSFVKTGLMYLAENVDTVVSPFSHQSLMVLYLNVNTLTSLPCHSPEIRLIKYYQESDMTLGQYLQELCFDSSYFCPADTCKRPMLLHFRSYVHGSAKVNVIIEDFPCPVPDMRGNILMWSYCRYCASVTPVVPMSEWTWRYSFGKFLELGFCHERLVNRLDACHHSLMRDHVRYFGLKDVAVRFEYETIDLFEVLVPPTKTSESREIMLKIKETELDVIRQGIINYYQSILERIRNFHVDEMSLEKINVLKTELGALGKRVPQEKSAMLQMLQEKFVSTEDTDTLSLNQVRKVLYENCCAWDREFAELIRKFVIPEKSADKRPSSTFGKILLYERENSRIRSRGQLSAAESIGWMDQLAMDSPISMLTFTDIERWMLDDRHDDDQDAEFHFPVILQQEEQWPSKEPAATESSNVIQSLRSDIQDAEHELLHRESISSRFIRDKGSSASAHRALGSSFRRQRSHSRPRSVKDSSNPELVASMLLDVSVRQSTYSDDWRHIDEVHADLTSPEEQPMMSPPLLSEKSPKVKLAQIMSIPSDDDEDDGFDDFTTNYTTVVHTSAVTSPDSLDDSLVVRRKETQGSTHSNKSGGLPLGVMGAQKDLLGSGDVEKVSIMKTLKDLWTQSSLGPSTQPMISLLGGETSMLNEVVGLKPLKYPFTLADHCIHDSDIIIKEDEPTSIIAFALNSRHYREEIVRLRKSCEKARDSTMLLLDLSNTPMPSPLKEAIPAVPTLDDEKYEKSSFRESRSSSTMEEAEELQQKPTSRINQDSENAGLEFTLSRIAGTHISYEFTAGTTKCYCRVYFAEQFDAIRTFSKANEGFVQSLSRCLNWKARGGQSGNFFFKTSDDRFIMKQLSKAEMDAFVRFAPSYFEYIAQSFFHELPSAMVKLFGVYRIGFKSLDNRSLRIDVVVMENLFYARSPARIFDLKGSMRNRHVRSTGKTSEVLLDENLLEIIGESPLFVREHAKKLLRASVWNDTLFLSKLNVMDYSLLVGIDEHSNELVVGIVDFIRTFTWDKKLESWVKETGFLGGGGKEPTIISPKQYKTRFRESMERYFVLVPDKFCDTSSVPNLQ